MVGTFLAFVKKTLNRKKTNVTSVVNSFSDPGDTDNLFQYWSTINHITKYEDWTP